MLKHNVLGICNLHYSPHLGELTERRPLGAVSFLGRYALIDFPLSNFLNSGIDQVGILVRNNPRAILQHLGSGNIWNANTKVGFQTVMYNEKGTLNQRFNTDIANLNENYWVLKKADPDYVVVAPGHLICTIDFNEYLEKHIENGADATLIYQHCKTLNSDFVTSQILEIDANKTVLKTFENSGKQQEGNVFLDMMILNRACFDRLLNEASSVSLIYGLSEMIRHLIEKREIRVLALPFVGYAQHIGTLKHYFQGSLDLLNHQNRLALFRSEHPIYTLTHDTPPCRFGKNAKVMNSFIANGAIIDGSVENCIISRNVHVSEHAKLKNCIIFSDTHILGNCELVSVIVDKNSQILNDLQGSQDEPLYIGQGVKI